MLSCSEFGPSCIAATSTRRGSPFRRPPTAAAGRAAPPPDWRRAEVGVDAQHVERRRQNRAEHVHLVQLRAAPAVERLLLLAKLAARQQRRRRPRQRRVSPSAAARRAPIVGCVTVHGNPTADADSARRGATRPRRRTRRRCWPTRSAPSQANAAPALHTLRENAVKRTIAHADANLLDDAASTPSSRRRPSGPRSIECAAAGGRSRNRPIRTAGATRPGSQRRPFVAAFGAAARTRPTHRAAPRRS